MIGTQQRVQTYIIAPRGDDFDTLPFVERPLRAGDIVEHPLMEHRYQLLRIVAADRERTGVFHRVRANGAIDRRCKPFEDTLLGYARP